MTVETTSFLSSAKITSNGSEKSAKFLKNHKNLIIFLLAIILLLFCVSASILQIWIFNRMNGMQDEIDQLRGNVAELKDNVEELKKNAFDDDLFDDFDDFKRKYNQNDIKEEIDLDDSLNISDGKNKFDDVGEEDDSLENSDESDDNYEAIHSGYGDNYDEDDEDQYDLDSIEDTPVDAEKDDDDNNIYKDMTKSRKSRSIAGVTDQGVVILTEPYISRKNRTRPASGVMLLNERDEKNPKLKLTWDNNRRNVNSPRREHYDKLGNRYNQHSRHHHQNLHDSRTRFAFAAAPVQHSFENYGRKFDETPTTSAPIQSRRSRVMHVEDKSKAFKQVVRKDQLARLQEMRKAPEQWTPQNYNGRRRMPSVRRNLELKNARRMKITAVHYEADSSTHPAHRGGAKVTLNQHEYVHWKPAAWMKTHGMDRFFEMDSNGVLTVNDHGLFLIYAQVYYANNHDINGYVITLNNHEQYQCTAMTHSKEPVAKVNSCYTSGLINLKHGDRIQLKDHRHGSSVLMEPSRSFFGLIKINLLSAGAESSEVEAFGAEK